MLQKNIISAENLPRIANAKIGIVVSLFNRPLTERLEKKCVAALVESGVSPSVIKIFHVPGSFEIPFFCQKLAQTKNYDALIALGVIVKGDTYHFELVASECARGVMDVMLKCETPIVFEVLAGSREDMEKRCGDDEYNKGIEAANTVLRLLESISKLSLLR